MEKEKLVALVKKAQKGNKQALNDLFTETYKDVYYFAKKTVKNQTLAEDVVQEAFVSIFQNIGTLGDPAAYPAWSRQITYRLCLQHLKKEAHKVTVDENEDGSTIFDTIEESRTEFIPGETLDKEDLKNTITQMIDGLPEEQRTAILLYYYDELSIKEIAEIQGTTEGTVKSRLNYGRKAVKASVEAYEKKHNVKLHCAGVLPLLLWLFASDVSACAMSAAAVEAVATGISAATGTALSVTSAVKNGAKVAWALWQKIVAGLSATAIAVGGAVAVVNLTNEPEPAPTEPEVQIWQGQGNINVGANLSDKNEFVLEVNEMDDAHIKGILYVTSVGGNQYQRNFEGGGTTLEDGKILYTIAFDEPVEVYEVLPSFVTEGYSEIEMEYDPEASTFTIGGMFFSIPYNVVLTK